MSNEDACYLNMLKPQVRRSNGTDLVSAPHTFTPAVRKLLYTTNAIAELPTAESNQVPRALPRR